MLGPISLCKISEFERVEAKELKKSNCCASVIICPHCRPPAAVASGLSIMQCFLNCLETPLICQCFYVLCYYKGKVF